MVGSDLGALRARAGAAKADYDRKQTELELLRQQQQQQQEHDDYEDHQQQRPPLRTTRRPASRVQQPSTPSTSSHYSSSSSSSSSSPTSSAPTPRIATTPRPAPLPSPNTSHIHESLGNSGQRNKRQGNGRKEPGPQQSGLHHNITAGSSTTRPVGDDDLAATSLPSLPGRRFTRNQVKSKPRPSSSHATANTPNERIPSPSHASSSDATDAYIERRSSSSDATTSTSTELAPSSPFATTETAIEQAPSLIQDSPNHQHRITVPRRW